MSLTIYTSPTCMPCRSTKKWLTKKGIKFNDVDITQSPDAVDKIRELGYSAVPVIVADDTHWQGYQPDLLATLA